MPYKDPLKAKEKHREYYLKNRVLKGRLKHTDEFKEKMRQFHTGKKWSFGIKRSEESKSKQGESIKGSNHYRWIKDRSKIKQYWTERNNPEYKQWRKEVWTRDSFKCKIQDDNCQGRIEAHHILGWTEHPELRYKTNNGITLCHALHPRKRAEEKRLVPNFRELVLMSVSKG